MVSLRAHSIRAKIVKNVNNIISVLKNFKISCKIVQVILKKEAPKGFDKSIALNIDRVPGA